MNAVPDIQPQSTGTALTVAQRAAVALNSSEHERKLLELAQASKSITAITNAAGREQCHSARMALKRVRVDIEKTGKAAREEATAFSKAVIAEERRLISLTEPEETRLGKIQSEYDEKIAAEKRAKEQAEAQRKADIQARIDDIRNLPADLTGRSSAEIDLQIANLRALAIDDSFQEFKPQAEGAKATAIVRLEKMLTLAIAAEAEARRLEQERAAQEAERQRLARERAEQEAAAAKERERIAEEERRARAAAAAEAARQAEELRLQREAQEAAATRERQRLEEEARQAQLRREAEEREHQARLRRQREEEEAQAAERRRALDEEERAAAKRREAEEARLAAERADLQAQQEALRVQQEAVARPSDPVEATDAEDVKIVVEEGPARPSDAEIIDAVAESFEVSAEVAAGWIAEMGICRGEGAK